MTSVLSNPFSRSLLAAGLAFAGTLVSFGATVTPAHAGINQSGINQYSAKLVAAPVKPRDKVVNGVVWKCAGDACIGPVDGARPLNTCVQVVRAFGKVAGFAGPKGAFSSDDLQRCNKGK